eukprot:1598131-Rhodomonas_salina.6
MSALLCDNDVSTAMAMKAPARQYCDGCTDPHAPALSCRRKPSRRRPGAATKKHTDRRTGD